MGIPSVEQALAEGWYRPNTNGGICMCMRCGLRTFLAQQTDKKHGYLQGQPKRYRRGHHDYFKDAKNSGRARTEPWTAFNRTLHDYRLARDISLEDASDALGVCIQTLRQWEKNRFPQQKAKHLPVLARMYGVEEDLLWELIEESGKKTIRNVPKGITEERAFTDRQLARLASEYLEIEAQCLRDELRPRLERHWGWTRNEVVAAVASMRRRGFLVTPSESDECRRGHKRTQANTIKNGFRADGTQNTQCRECMNESQRRRRDADPERAHGYRARYWESNRDEINRKRRESYRATDGASRSIKTDRQRP